jgi:hypothetical protein
MTDELSGDARTLIARALDQEALAPRETLNQIRRRVASACAAAGTVAAAGKAAAAGGASILGAGASAGLAQSVVTSLLIGAALGVGVSLGPQVVSSPSERQPPAAEARAAPARSVPVERDRSARTEPRVTAEAPAPEPTPVRALAVSQKRSTRGANAEPRARKPTQARTEAAAAPASGSGESSLVDELALLERVQVALRAGDGARALGLLEAKPGARQLAAEHMAAEVLAACQVGQLERAHRVAERFLAQHPTGPLAARVRGSCAGSPRGQ